MPAWLITFLTGLIKPIVEKIISNLLLDLRIQNIEKKQEAQSAAFLKMAAAQTDEERDSALKDLAHVLNS